MGSDYLMDSLRKLEVSIRESGPVLLVLIRIRSDFSEVLRFVIAKLFYFQKLDILFGQVVPYTRESKKYIRLF